MAKTQLILLVALALLVCSVSAFYGRGYGWGYRGYPLYGGYAYGSYVAPVYGGSYYYPSYGYGYGYPYVGYFKK